MLAWRTSPLKQACTGQQLSRRTLVPGGIWRIGVRKPRWSQFLASGMEHWGGTVEAVS